MVSPNNFCFCIISHCSLKAVDIGSMYCWKGSDGKEENTGRKEWEKNKRKWFSLSKYECRFYKLFQAPKDFSEHSLKYLCFSDRLVKDFALHQENLNSMLHTLFSLREVQLEQGFSNFMYSESPRDLVKKQNLSG